MTLQGDPAGKPSDAHSPSGGLCNPEALFSRGVAQLELGLRNIAEAISLIDQAVAIDPRHPHFFWKRGLAYAASGDVQTAEKSYLKALELDPNLVPALLDLGTLSFRFGRLDQSLACYEKANRLIPQNSRVHIDLGIVLRAAGRLSDAAASFERAAQTDSSTPVPFAQLGDLYFQLGRYAEAEAAFRRALARTPSRAAQNADLGVALHYQDRFQEALPYYTAAFALEPRNAQVLNNLSHLSSDMGSAGDAVRFAQLAVEADPQSAMCHYTFATALLRRGELEPGFREHEWRFALPRMAGNVERWRKAGAVRWYGQRLEGRSILLVTEQGYGDTLQFFRYVHIVTRLARSVSLECQSALVRLLSINTSAAVLEQGAALPCYDYYCPLMSLPLVCNTRLDSVPADTPYLVPDNSLAAVWQQRLEKQRNIRVGLAWAGQHREGDAAISRTQSKRSIHFSLFAQLLAMPGVAFYSLQKGEPVQHGWGEPAAGELIDWTDALHDFADTAALIANLDLVISVDTAVAHLAAAMGKPTWILSRFNGCWRWLENRDDSPWYPTVRLFRQTKNGDWNEVMGRVRAALEKFEEANA